MHYQGKPIDALILDLGGVILNIDYQRPIEAFRKLGLDDFGTHFSQAAQSKLLDDYETGKISSAEFIDALRPLVKPGTSDEAIIDAWNSILLDLPPERLDALDRLSEKYRLFLLSNTNDLHIECFNADLLDEHQLPSLEPFFETLYYSYEVGLRKPDPAIFNYIIEEAGLNPERTLFVDDSKQHIESAMQLGLQVHWLQPGTLLEFIDQASL